ncbi:Cytochrome P450 superfamily protein [Pleurotus pulmonarius]
MQTVLLKVLGSALSALGAYGVYKLFKFVYGEFTSSLRYLPGPKSSSWIYGNFREIFDAENSVLHEQWVKEYGPTIKYRGLFGVTRLYTTDPKALNHILMNTDVYQKPEMTRHALGRVLGEGVLIVEGEKHRRQRKIMNPAFGPIQVRDLTEIFVQKAIQLRDVWAAETAKEGSARIDVLSWLSRMTLDVIGLAGFNYKFDALVGEPNELNQAFSTIFQASTKFEVFPLLQAFFPPFRLIKTQRDRQTEAAREVMTRIGNQLLKSSKEAVVQAEKDHIDNGLKSRNLLSLLVKANTAANLPDHQRLSDDDVLAQVPTFLGAGHETTSTGTTWALFALTQSPEVQRKLREELLTVPTDTPTMDELNALPYLDAVVRETMRVHAPVPSTVRVAVADDVLPLSVPLTDLKGDIHQSVAIKKGQLFIVPIVAMNRMVSVWGEDAFEFKPERWQSPPEAASVVPGIWSNMMTFLGGPRACIGWRFSIVEMKALLFTLVRSFEFELAVPSEEIGKISSIVQRPILKHDKEAGNVMPLIIKPYQRE